MRFAKQDRNCSSKVIRGEGVELEFGKEKARTLFKIKIMY